jgi:hypothetical protein
MSPMRFPRVGILKDNKIVEYGYLDIDNLPDTDNDTDLYQIFGDSARIYLLMKKEFVYTGENDVN